MYTPPNPLTRDFYFYLNYAISIDVTITSILNMSKWAFCITVLFTVQEYSSETLFKGSELGVAEHFKSTLDPSITDPSNTFAVISTYVIPAWQKTQIIIDSRTIF